jgi:predicted GNAT superfamily acetyltransferase
MRGQVLYTSPVYQFEQNPPPVPEHVSASPISPPAAEPADGPGVSIRRVASESEYEQCVELQHEIWGESYSGVVPAVILALAQRLGGVVAGAFAADGALLGFVFGMTGLIDGQLGHWSDLLAVSAAARDRGIGRSLKHFQRDAVRALGIHTMHWTYDPLVARNAYLNLVKLGATACEYVIDFYGAETGSSLHGSLGTDRFIVRWNIGADSDPRGHAALHPAADPDDGPLIVNPARGAAPPTPGDLPILPRVRIEIPPDIHTLVDRAPEAALAWRTTTRRAFTWYLARGYRVAAFSAAPDMGRCFYTLSASET